MKAGFDGSICNAEMLFLTYFDILCFCATFAILLIVLFPTRSLDIELQVTADKSIIRYLV